MDDIAIPDISQLTVSCLRVRTRQNILVQFATRFKDQREREDLRYEEVKEKIRDRPTFEEALKLFKPGDGESIHEYVHVSILQNITQALRKELVVVSEQVAQQNEDWQNDKKQTSQTSFEEFQRVKSAVSDLKRVVVQNRRLHDLKIIHTKRIQRNVRILKAWKSLHSLCFKQRFVLKRFFLTAFRTRMSKRFADWKHAALSIRLRNVEMNISRCSIISQDCLTQTTGLKEECGICRVAGLKEKKAEQTDYTQLRTFVDSIDISQAVGKLQTNLTSKVEELGKERRALEYRMKESLATIEGVLSTRLADTSLDPLRESQKMLMSALQDIDKRLVSASSALSSIDLSQIKKEFDEKMRVLEARFQGMSEEMQGVKEELSAKQYSELISARPFHQQGCLSCGLRPIPGVPKVPGLMGADHKLYKGDVHHNNVANPSRARVNSIQKTEGNESEFNKPTLSLTAEGLKLGKTITGSPRRRNHFSVIPQMTPISSVSPVKFGNFSMSQDLGDAEEEERVPRLKNR